VNPRGTEAVLKVSVMVTGDKAYALFVSAPAFQLVRDDFEDLERIERSFSS